ncbi:MAG: hypothetical protein KatS3mg068_0393 [Candidatus Sericytochromatia bacterium]|nr:MAG: hypothetical protein KatS3mg068_0393 [Candidatus Sericytochromatia bacterium]
MKHLYYLLSLSNNQNNRNLNLFFKDISKNIDKKNPNILVFSNQDSDIKNSDIFNFFCELANNINLFDNDNFDLKNEILKSDIVYFHGGNPYKYTTFSKYKQYLKNTPIKIGNSAGAIFLSNHTFYAQKDDYIIAIPNMLNFINLHVFAHSEIYKEDIVFNYLLYENPTNILRLYGDSCLKIEYDFNSNTQKVYSIIEDKLSRSKIELYIKNISYTYTDSQEIDIIEKLVI